MPTQVGTIDLHIHSIARNEFVRTRRVACRKTPKLFLVMYLGYEHRFDHEGWSKNKRDPANPHRYYVDPTTFVLSEANP